MSRSALRHRSQAQTLVFAAIAMVAIIGAVGLVVDFGMFFVIQRQMQSAANAAALAAVWYPRVCNDADPDQVAAGCQAGASITPTGECITGSHPTDHDEVPCTVAHQFAEANLGPTAALCRGPLSSADPNLDIHAYVIGHSNRLNVQIYAVTIGCDAQHWFGRILPQIGFVNRISTTGVATIGWLGANGDLASVPLVSAPLGNGALIARLVGPESNP
jgi:Flp pilus assembly protein TadG